MDLPTNFEYHYLTVNLTKIDITYNNLLKQAQEFNDVVHIQYLAEKLSREINGIQIVRRSKRGLVNAMGTVYKYLFGTLDNDDKEELEDKIKNLAENSIQANELNYIIDAINKGLETVNSIVSEKEKSIKLELLIFNLEHFTEYIEDIEMGMQLTRLGIFNPKLLKHNYLNHVDSEKLLNTKTSTWLKTDTNEILIISHIPREIIKTPIFEILPYPDPEKNILTENSHDKYYFENKNVYNKNTKQLETNECIIGILKQVTTSCKYTKTFKNYQITYIEPNIIVTWNLPKTKLNQDCVNNELTIEGNNIIQIYDCSLQLNEISIKNSYFDYSQSIYVTNNITKLEPISYLQTKEIINQHTKYNSVFQTITIITFVIIILSITLYLIYKLKIVPQKLIINVNNKKKPDLEIPNPVIEQSPSLYPKISA